MKIETIVFDAYGTLYDVQSVARVTEDAYPGYGEVLTQIWRLKQLEYTWLRSLMDRYEDFWEVTREALAYAVDCLGLPRDAAMFDRIMNEYRHLDLYPEAAAALAALRGHKLAILSNGSPAMLDALVRNSGLDAVLDTTISVDAAKAFKPNPRTYALIESTLGTPPSNVLFVSSNGFDVCGAKSFGLNVAWIERVQAATLARELESNRLIRPLTMFRALRMRMEPFGMDPDYRIGSLAELGGLVAGPP